MAVTHWKIEAEGENGFSLWRRDPGETEPTRIGRTYPTAEAAQERMKAIVRARNLLRHGISLARA